MPAHKKDQARVLPLLRVKEGDDPSAAIAAALKEPDPKRREKLLLAMNVAYVVRFKAGRPPLYRIQLVRADGQVVLLNRPSIEEVARARVGAELAQRQNAQMTVRRAIDTFMDLAVGPTGTQASSNQTKRGRLLALLDPVLDQAVARLTKDRCRRLYEGRASAELGPDGKPMLAEHGYIHKPTKKTGRPPAPDTHIATLKVCQEWSAWLRDQGLSAVDLFEGIKARGKKKKGGFGRADTSYAEQMLLDRTCEQVLANLDKYPEKKQLPWRQRATAVIVALRCGVRTKELRTARCRQLSIIHKPDGVWGILEIVRENAKNEPSVRKLTVRPETMRHLLPLAQGKTLEQFIFCGAPRGRMGGLGGPNWQRDPDVPLTERWLDNSLARLSKLAGIRRDNPHGLRGAFNDLSKRGGADLEAAARALGHGQTVNEQVYSNAEVASEQAQRAVLESLGHLVESPTRKGVN